MNQAEHYNHIGFLIKCIDKTIVCEVNKALEAYDLTASQHEVLTYLYFFNGEGAIFQKDIEKYLNLSNPTVTGIVKRLEAKGMLERFQGKEDGRYKRLELTGKGMDVIEKTVDIGPSEMENKLTKCLTETEAKELERLLGKVMASFQEEVKE